MKIFDVVKFDGLVGRDWIVYKFPSEGLVWGTPLIVQEGQIAIFVKGGEVYDLMYPGTYTLESANLPILSKFVNIPFGGRSPFTAEIYFVNTTTKLDIYWGTSDPISLIDPKYFVKLRIRAFGQMGLKLLDPGLFFRELIGGMNKGEIIKYDKVKEFYRGLVVLKTKSVIAETIINEQISALEISAKLEDISEKSKGKLEAEFERFGLRVANFFVESINFPEEDFEKINAILANKAEFEIMGDGRYVTKRSFDVYQSAAENENGVAGAFVAGGMGFGMGMNMGANLNNPAFNPAYQGAYQGQPAAYQGQPAPYQGQPAQGAGTFNCPSCGALLQIGTKFCNECGQRLQPVQKICPNCNASLPAGSKFCSECGTTL
ncbi:MAG: SPFH domain-containing protein [Lachnospiraceae bacterium]|nr:SPFH domain-containing protein [Lachnospiraceae bacterium]